MPKSQIHNCTSCHKFFLFNCRRCMTVGVGAACSLASTSACSSLSLSFSFSLATATPVSCTCRLLTGQILLDLLHQSSLPGAEREAGSGGAAHLGARGMSAGAGAGGRRRLQRAAERRAARCDCVSERRAERREWRSHRAGTIADWELGIWDTHFHLGRLPGWAYWAGAIVASVCSPRSSTVAIRAASQPPLAAWPCRKGGRHGG